MMRGLLRSRRSARWRSLILFGIFAIALWHLFGEETPQPSGQNRLSGTNQDAVQLVMPIDAKAYALEPLRNTWPTLESTGEILTDPHQLLTSNYYVVLDGSGSMKERKCSGRRSKMEVAIDALATVARELSADANFGFGIFNRGEIHELIPLGIGQRDQIQRLASSFNPDGATPLYSALKFALDRLTDQGRRQLGYGEYNLVIVTDGLASSGQDPTPMLQYIFEQTPVNLHTIGFCISDQHSLNQPNRSIYRSANDPASLSRGLQAVLAEAAFFDVTSFEQTDSSRSF